MPDSFAWCGWLMDVPEGWRPVKIEGDEQRGEMLFADLDRPLMGLRWDTPPKKVWRAGNAAEQLVAGQMQAEVGQLSAAEAKAYTLPGGTWRASQLFLEPEPPGRDVWIGLSEASRRVLQIVHHRRTPGSASRRLPEALLPTLIDQPTGEATRWALFDIDLQVPPGYRLLDHKLAAGDMRISFVREEPLRLLSRRRWPLVVRQLRPAKLALARRKPDEWLKPFAWEASRFHDPGRGTPVRYEGLSAWRRVLRRRRRYGWLWTVPPRLEAVVVHDPDQDRLLLLRGGRSAIRQALRSQLATTSRVEADEVEGAGS